MDGRRPRLLGIVGQVVPAADLEATAQALAEAIARNSPTAMAPASGRCGRLRGRADRGQPGRRQDLVAMWGHPDQAEGPRAFAEGRPAWQPLDPGVTGPGPGRWRPGPRPPQE